MMMSNDVRFNTGLEILHEAGALALDYFNARETLTIQSKGPQDVVSEADMQTELLIRRRLAEAFPEDAFLGEETGRTEYAREQGIWVVDPIDGTQPFVSGLTSWCVSMAYLKAEVLQFGMVFAPARNELFAGGLEIPATANGKPVARHAAKSVRDGITFAGYSPKAAPVEFLPAFTRFLDAGGMFYRDGSGALGLCYVAAGRLIGFYEPMIKSWDCLGALAVVHAAGLKHNDFLANDGLHNGNPLLAANAEVYSELRDLIGNEGWGGRLK
jgi:myo-inositol-1(or 4)-monophosphatase